MSAFKPYTVGESNVLVVGVEGVVEAITPDTVTINGTTLPKRMGDGVRYLSMTWPEPHCEREHCDDNGCDIDPEEDLRADHEALIDVIASWHDTQHWGAFRFCEHGVCKEANQ